MKEVVYLWSDRMGLLTYSCVLREKKNINSWYIINKGCVHAYMSDRRNVPNGYE